MSRSFEHLGRTVVFDDSGDGQSGRVPIVLLHGASENRSVWAPAVQRLGQLRRVIAVDMPGCGASSGPAVDSVDGRVEVVEALWAECGLGSAYVVGHSLGGAMAQAFYNRDASRVQGLALLATASDFGVTEDLAKLWAGDPRLHEEQELMATTSHASAEVRDRIAAIRAGNGDAAATADVWAVSGYSNQAWGEISVPTLVVTAQHESPQLRDFAANWAKVLPDASLVDMSGVGHMMTIEDGDGCGAVLEEWLRELEASRTGAPA